MARLHKLSYPTAFNIIYEREGGTHFACIKPHNDAWLLLSPYFVNEEIDEFIDGIKTIFPKSCKVCSSNDEFGMTWAIEEPIVFCLKHNEQHGW